MFSGVINVVYTILYVMRASYMQIIEDVPGKFEITGIPMYRGVTLKALQDFKKGAP